MPHDHSEHRHGSRLDEPTPDKPLGRDERVSFYPMDPEDVLKKLLRTPPSGRVQDKPSLDNPDPA